MSEEVKCSHVHTNRMQCIRPAKVRPAATHDNREALCSVCLAIHHYGEAEDYELLPEIRADEE
jgi:hypothetical protein